ncbi:MAG: hypothetical protein KDD51_07280 [Bdellovibrionales bacterium]|nr:hypothetical protein [Bdellovibrionales bacterium]
MITRALFLLSLALCFPLSAKDTPMDLKVLPKLSEAGYKRLRKNLEAIDKNIKLLQENLQTIEGNLKTIKGETEELDKLGAENQDLVTNYKGYITKAQSEDAKNRQALDRLVKWKSRLQTAADASKPLSEERAQLKRAEEEIANRKMWQQDAAAKTARAQQLMAELRNNQSKINAKKNALSVESKLWETRFNNYRTMLRELEKDRSSYTQILARTPYY